MTKKVFRPVPQPPKKRKFEFSKFIVALYAFFCIAWIQQDYIMAFMYQQPINYHVTIVVIPSIAAAILGYYFKSFKEKESRNEHGLDENGLPYDMTGQKEKCGEYVG